MISVEALNVKACQMCSRNSRKLLSVEKNKQQGSSRVEDREISMCGGPCRPLTRINLNEVEWKSCHLTSVLLILDQRGKGGSRKAF